MASLAPSTIHVPSLALHSNVSQGENSPSSMPLVPRSDFDDAYVPFQALHIRGFVSPPSSISPPKCGAGRFDACDVQPLFESLNNQDKKSWCIENKLDEGTSPEDFLGVDKKNQKGYCSFLVQHSKIVMEDLLSNRLPAVHLPVANGSETATCDKTKVYYGPCLWLFFGKNYVDGGRSSSLTLQGRPEHTDSVTHDGTWHYQLSGTKIWRLRPTTELMQRMKEHNERKLQEQTLSGTKRKFGAADGKCHNENFQANINCDNKDKKFVEVECKQGDFLLLNTRLWWHSTLIPPQDVPSISYARDVYFSNTGKTPDSLNEGKDNEDGKKKEKQDQIDHQQANMTNVDGTYAAEDIEAETVLFTEHNMPDCELHRSRTNPNCQVVELEDEKTGESYMAVVSLRYINAGEFFCTLESDEGEESGSDEHDWDDDD